MKRKLSNKDRFMVLDYLNIRASYSIFLVADILKFGFESEIFSVWGSFNAFDIPEYIFGRYYKTLMIYAVQDDIDDHAIHQYIENNNIDYKILVARRELSRQFCKTCAFASIHDAYLCELVREDFIPIYNCIRTEIASVSDAEEIVALRSGIEEFKGMDMGLASIRAVITEGRTIVIREHGRIVSSAMCSAVAGKLANIGGVCTHRAYRRQGYASMAVSDLCALLISQGYTCSLSFDNPIAGSIYKRIGFKEIGMMRIAIK